MCEHYSLLLSAYLDDEVTLAERAWVEGHLVGCADCRAELQALRETARFTALLPELLPPAHLRSLILQRTTRRPTLWGQMSGFVRRPAIWSPALAAGVVGVVFLASHSGKSPVPITSPNKPAQRTAMAAKPKSLPKDGSKVATTAALRKKPGGETARVKQRIENVFASVPAPAVAASPVSENTHRASEPRVTLGTKVAAPRPRAALVASRPAVAPPDPLARVKGSIAQVRDKIRVGLIPARRPKKASPKSPSSERNLEKVLPDSAASDETTVAMSPPMVHMPEMPVAPPASGPARDPDAEAAATSRSNNPVADTLTKLSASPKQKQRTDMDEMVEQLNANALSTASAARQVKWKFARYKF